MNTENIQSDYKKYKAHFKKCFSENPVKLVWVPLREYGFFIIFFAAAYLCIYFAIFDKNGMESATRVMCAIVGVCILVVTFALIFLRKLIRRQRFYKYSGEPTPLFRGNRWNCPCCRSENNLLSPCPRCGIYPVLYKSDTAAPNKIHYEKRSKKVQKQFEEYKNQFDSEEI